MVASMKIAGFRELDALLKALPRNLDSTGVSAGMRKALQPVAAAAQAYAPGGLDTSIKINSRIKKSQRAAALEKPGSGRRVMYVGSTAPHAHLVEFGTGPRFQRNGKYVGIMPPDPFLRPAWDANKDQVLANLARAVREEIEKALRRRIARAIKGKR